MAECPSCVRLREQVQDLNGAIERLHKLLTSPTSGTHNVTGNYQVEPHNLMTRYEAELRPPDQRARCPECGGRFQLKKDGTLRDHRGDRYVGGWRQTCTGVGKPPEPTAPKDSEADDG